MAESLTPINSLANNTMTSLVALANSIVGVLATTVVTANGSANGALTTGNGYVSGIFGSSVLTTGLLRGGTIQTPATLVIGSNTFINVSTLSVGNSTVNTTVNGTNITVQTANVSGNAQVSYFNQSYLAFANANVSVIEYTNSNTNIQTLDTFPLTTYRTADYVIQVKDNVANNFQSSKITLIHDGSNPYYTEYALLYSNNVIATYSLTSNATTMILQVTPASSNSSFRLLRTTLTA
jgi:hypothetical protein